MKHHCGRPKQQQQQQQHQHQHQHETLDLLAIFLSISIPPPSKFNNRHRRRRSILDVLVAIPSTNTLGVYSDSNFGDPDGGGNGNNNGMDSGDTTTEVLSSSSYHCAVVRLYGKDATSVMTLFHSSSSTSSSAVRRGDVVFLRDMVRYGTNSNTERIQNVTSEKAVDDYDNDDDNKDNKDNNSNHNFKNDNSDENEKNKEMDELSKEEIGTKGIIPATMQVKERYRACPSTIIPTNYSPITSPHHSRFSVVLRATDSSLASTTPLPSCATVAEGFGTVVQKKAHFLFNSWFRQQVQSSTDTIFIHDTNMTIMNGRTKPSSVLPGQVRDVLARIISIDRCNLLHANNNRNGRSGHGALKFVGVLKDVLVDNNSNNNDDWGKGREDDDDEWGGNNANVTLLRGCGSILADELEKNLLSPSTKKIPATIPSILPTLSLSKPVIAFKESQQQRQKRRRNNNDDDDDNSKLRRMKDINKTGAVVLITRLRGVHASKFANCGGGGDNNNDFNEMNYINGGCGYDYYDGHMEHHAWTGTVLVPTMETRVLSMVNFDDNNLDANTDANANPDANDNDINDDDISGYGDKYYEKINAEKIQCVTRRKKGIGVKTNTTERCDSTIDSVNKNDIIIPITIPANLVGMKILKRKTTTPSMIPKTKIVSEETAILAVPRLVDLLTVDKRCPSRHVSYNTAILTLLPCPTVIPSRDDDITTLPSIHHLRRDSLHQHQQHKQWWPLWWMNNRKKIDKRTPLMEQQQIQHRPTIDVLADPKIIQALCADVSASDLFSAIDAVAKEDNNGNSYSGVAGDVLDLLRGMIMSGNGENAAITDEDNQCITTTSRKEGERVMLEWTLTHELLINGEGKYEKGRDGQIYNNKNNKNNNSNSSNNSNSNDNSNVSNNNKEHINDNIYEYNDISSRHLLRVVDVSLPCLDLNSLSFKN